MKGCCEEKVEWIFLFVFNHGWLHSTFQLIFTRNNINKVEFENYFSIQYGSLFCKTNVLTLTCWTNCYIFMIICTPLSALFAPFILIYLDSVINWYKGSELLVYLLVIMANLRMWMVGFLLKVRTQCFWLSINNSCSNYEMTSTLCVHKWLYFDVWISIQTDIANAPL